MDRLEVCGAVDDQVRRTVRWMIGESLVASALLAESLDSTNSESLRWLESTAAECVPASLPRLIVADHQTAGRGRHGRSWLSAHGGLAFSITLPLDSPLGSLIAGVAVALAIESLAGPLRAGLKWPNDVWLSEAKVAGILIERTMACSSVSVIGIGINLAASPDLSTHPSSTPGTSLLQATGRHISRGETLQEIVASLIEVMDQTDQDASWLIDQFQSRCQLTGRLVTASVGDKTITGYCTGVLPDGSLNLQTEQGPRSLRSGEVTRIR